MLPRKHRLAKVRDFAHLKETGKTRRTRFFTVRYTKTEQKDSRVAVIVSAKVSKKAVERNKLKRRLRNILSKRLRDLPKHTDVAFYAHGSASKATFSDIEADIEQLLNG